MRHRSSPKEGDTDQPAIERNRNLAAKPYKGVVVNQIIQERRQADRHLDALPLLGKSAILVSVFVLLSEFQIVLIGTLPLSELFAILCLPFLGVPRLLKRYPVLNHALMALGLLLFGLMVADFLNGTALQDSLRGWAGVVMTGVVLTFLLAVFDRNPKAIIWFFVVSAIVALASTDGVFDLAQFSENPNYIKMGPTSYLVPLVFLVAFFLERRNVTLTTMFLLVAGLVLMLFNARSAGLGVMLGGVMHAYRMGFQINVRTVLVWVSALVGLYLLFVLYMYSVLRWEISHSTLTQLRPGSNPYNPLGLLFAGRTETFVAMQAIWDNPLIGFGSWGADPDGRYWALLYEFKGLGGLITERGYIPSHSIVVTGWLWGGVLGLAGMVWLTWLVLNSVRCVRWFPVGFRVIAYVLFAVMLWHWFFSPIGHMRSSILLALAFIWAGTRVFLTGEECADRAKLLNGWKPKRGFGKK